MHRNIIDNDIEKDFLYCCADGNLEEAKSLYSSHKEINIRAYNDKAFVLSCRYKHIDIANWLYSLDPNICVHTNNSQLFKKTVKKEIWK